MLVMELLMLCASRSDFISELRLFPGFVFISKSPDAQDAATLVLDGLYFKRGIEICGTQNLNLSGITRLIANRIAQRAQRRLQRTKQKLSRAARKAHTPRLSVHKPTEL